jgi:hydroxypyruvate reductase
MSQEIMQLTNLPSVMMTELQKDYIVHDHRNVKEPAVLQRVTALVGDHTAKVDRNLLVMLPNVKLIVIVGADYEQVDVEVAKAKRIMVTHTPGLHIQDQADLTFALMLGVSRRIAQADRFLRNGDWVDEPFPLTRRVSAARLGIVGCDALAQAIAQRASGFGMTTGYFGFETETTMPFKRYDTVESLAIDSDYLVLTQNSNSSILVDASVLKALGPRGYLINTVKAHWVDQNALIQALQDKSIAGAGLDVFWDEPRVPSQLRTFPNVVLTPHTGSETVEAKQEMAALALSNLRDFFKGEPVRSPVPQCRLDPISG